MTHDTPRLVRTRCLIGGASRDRTDDLRVANATLSQLSYGPLSIGRNRLDDFGGHHFVGREQKAWFLLAAFRRGLSADDFGGHHSVGRKQRPGRLSVVFARCVSSWSLRGRFRRISLRRPRATAWAPKRGFCSLRFVVVFRGPNRVWAVVGLGGVEPPTSPLSGVRSNQLSYRPRGPVSGSYPHGY